MICQLFWQQMAVRAVGVPQAVRMIDLKKAEKVLLVCLVAMVAFELLSLFLWQLGGGAFAALRGFASAAGRMGIFVFSYQLGMKELKPGIRVFFLILLSILVVQQAATLMLATPLPTLGIAFAGYILGAGRMPWKALICAVAAVTVLHAGKYDMREIYIEKREKSTGLMDYPRYFTEWIGYGLKNLGMGGKGEEKREDVSSTKERSLGTMWLTTGCSTSPCGIRRCGKKWRRWRGLNSKSLRLPSCRRSRRGRSTGKGRRGFTCVRATTGWGECWPRGWRF